MVDSATDIKSMKLYSHIDRVYNELAELGKSDDAPLTVAELGEFDQLHYHGTDAVDNAIQMIGIDQKHPGAGNWLWFRRAGSGISHINTGARITALELQA